MSNTPRGPVTIEANELSRRAAERAHGIVEHVSTPEYRQALQERVSQAIERARSIDFDEAIDRAARIADQVRQNYGARRTGPSPADGSPNEAIRQRVNEKVARIDFDEAIKRAAAIARQIGRKA
jgi:hypothetical protein